MTPDTTTTRCMARKLADPTLPKCPRRLECERYVLWVGTEVGQQVPVQAHMCQTDSFEYRIAPVYGDA